MMVMGTIVVGTRHEVGHVAPVEPQRHRGKIIAQTWSLVVMRDFRGAWEKENREKTKVQEGGKEG